MLSELSGVRATDSTLAWKLDAVRSDYDSHAEEMLAEVYNLAVQTAYHSSMADMSRLTPLIKTPSSVCSQAAVNLIDAVD